MIISELKKLPLFANIDEQIIINLLKESTNKISTYNESDFIAYQGDICRSLYFLYSGKVVAQMENVDGKFINIETLQAPELLAPAFIYGDENHFPVNIVAINRCEVLIIDKESFFLFMHDNPSVMRGFINDISNRCLFLTRKVNEFALQNLRSRIVNYLKRHKFITNQQAVAQILGVARPSLAKVLAEMIEENIIIKEDNKISLNSTI